MADRRVTTVVMVPLFSAGPVLFKITKAEFREEKLVRAPTVLILIHLVAPTSTKVDRSCIKDKRRERFRGTDPGTI